MIVGRFALVAIAVCGILAGCGRSGLPVPPDDYGIGMRIQQERQKEEQAKKEQETAIQPKAEGEIVTPPDEITLPDMRPVGGR